MRKKPGIMKKSISSSTASAPKGRAKGCRNPCKTRQPAGSFLSCPETRFEFIDALTLFLPQLPATPTHRRAHRAGIHRSPHDHAAPACDRGSAELRVFRKKLKESPFLFGTAP